MPAASVYLITNTANGKRYVGVTRYTLAKRWGEHKAGAAAGRGGALYAAMRKYGAEAFAIEPIASCLSIEDATAVEQEVIKSLRPEYNLTNGGEFTVGKRVLSAEVRERMRAAHVGKTITGKQRAQISETLKARYASDPDFKERSLGALERGRKKIDQAARVAALKRAGAAGKMNRPMTPQRLSRQLAAMSTPEARAQMAKSKSKAVECTTLNAAFDSVSEAAEATGVSVSGVSMVCLGKRASAHGLHFQFLGA